MTFHKNIKNKTISFHYTYDTLRNEKKKKVSDNGLKNITATVPYWSKYI